MSETEATETVTVPKSHYERLRSIAERVDPVCGDLMGEVSGDSPVQDWGAVNQLLVDAEKEKVRANKLEVA